MENGKLKVRRFTVANRFRYAGEQLDPIIGQYYLRARYYDPIVGRFTQEDTYRGDGLNLYSYVANNPVKYVDPSGHCKDGIKSAVEEIKVARFMELYLDTFQKSGPYLLSEDDDVIEYIIF